MSKMIEIALNDTGIKNILHNEAAEPCKKMAQGIAAGLDEELYRYYDINTSQRSGGGVSTVGMHGIYSNRKHHTLEKALGSAKQ